MPELTPEDVLAQLKTRGFEDGFPQSPLKEFTGRLVSIGGQMIERFTPPRLEVLYNFEEVEVIESTEPYTDPIAQVSILHSSRKQSAMGVFGMSVDTVINAGLDDDADPLDVKGQDYLVDKVLHMKKTGGHMMWDGKTKTEQARECWELIEILGEEAPAPAPAKPVTRPLPKAPAPVQSKGKAVAGADDITTAIDLLDGKTEQQFYQDFFNNASLKKNEALRTKLLGRKFIPELVAAGIINLGTDKLYHKLDIPF